MPNAFSWFSIVIIVVATVSGGLPPLRAKEPEPDRYPMSEAFASGVFLALALVMMLPSSFQLFQRVMPDAKEPIASIIAVAAMLGLLGISHAVKHLDQDMHEGAQGPSRPLIPILMTVMIAIPSFFLGAALGVSDTAQAVLLLIAILLHKSSAAFALALKLTDSSLSVTGTRLVFGLFVLATPAGIFFGSLLDGRMGADGLLLVRACVLAMAAGTFLFMGTLHDLQSTPLIKRCRHWRGFAAMLAGLGLTICARVLIGEAHSLG